MIAQGNALGSSFKQIRDALKGRNKGHLEALADSEAGGDIDFRDATVRLFNRRRPWNQVKERFFRRC